MPDLVSIHVTDDELARRLQQVSIGSAFDTVVERLGGQPYQEEEHAGVRRVWWRFLLSDRPATSGRYEIYVGEFVQDRLTFGAILPQG